MKFVRSLWMQTILACALIVYFSLLAAAQVANTPARITQPIDEANLVTLRGNTHPLARPQYDQGAAPDSLPTERMLLVLQRSAQQETALRQLLDGQQIKSSPNYHQWLTPEQFGQQFGPADADIQTVTAWLTSQGFQVGHVAAGRTIIEFSGTAGQVRQALHTEIHKYVVNGEEHWANTSDPQIPAALAPVVAGFASLNNFPKRPRVRHLGTFSKSKATGQVTPLFTFPYNNKGSLFAVGPTDFATIYNVTPLWNASINGSGQTIAVSEQSDINLQDVADFRTMFGLPVSAGNVKVIYNGPDPGVLSSTGDETEATLDVQWAGAVAKGATVDMVISEGTTTTAGVDLSALYIIDNNISPIMSESYGECEAFDGDAGIAFYNTLWEQGAAQGITILIAAGDSGSAGCDSPEQEYAAQDGLEVAGNSTTPFNVTVGGTDFDDVGNTSLYWNTTNGSGQSSAKSYIPEMTWNDTCASTGSLSLCNTDVPTDPAGADLAGGSGGPSDCSASTVTQSGIECTGGIAKPAWQTGPGVPSDSVRDVPDVSLFASDGYFTGSFYIFCEMDANAAGGGGGHQGGGSPTSCDLSSPYQNFQGGGGTSFATPAFAGIMAMVNQKTGQRQGNANYVLYPLAAMAGASCASNASAVGSKSCIFYDTQEGNNSVACQAGSLNCSNTGSSGYGILVVPSTTSSPAYPAGAGYDYATGLGTVNAANLVNNWTSASFAKTETALTLPTTTITHGQNANVTIKVSSGSGTPTGDASLIALTGSSPSNNTGIGPFTLSGGAFSGTTNLLPGGTYGVIAHYAGDGTFGASDSTPPFQITVNPESSQMLVRLAAVTDCNGDITYLSSGATIAYGYNIQCGTPAVPYPAYLLRVDVLNSSGNACFNTTTGLITYACPTGTVSVTDNGVALIDLGAPSGTAGAYTLNSQGHAEDDFIQLPGGTNGLVASYPGSNSYNASQQNATFTVTQASTTASINAPTTAQANVNVTLTAVVNTMSMGLAPSGTVTFLNGGSPIGGTPTYSRVNASASGGTYASLMATLSASFTANATVTAQYVGDSNYAGSTSGSTQITVAAGAGDFSLSASPTSITVPIQGDSETSTISISAINGFNGNVSLSCTVSSTMTGGGCSVPSPISTGNTAMLTVTTTAPSTVIGHFKSPRWLAPMGGALFAAFFLLLISTKKRRLKLAFGSLSLVLLAATLVACGGGGTSPTTVTTVPGTPTGTYTATVVGTSGSLTHSLNITVYVQ